MWHCSSAGVRAGAAAETRGTFVRCAGKSALCPGAGRRGALLAARVNGLLAAPGGRGVPLPVARARSLLLMRRARVSFAHRLIWEVFFPTRGKEPKGARWQPIRDSTMAAPGPLAAWVEGRNLLLRKANCFLAGAAWSGLGCCARCPLAAGRHRGAALAARRVVGFWLRLMARGTFARGAGKRGCSFPLAGKNQRAPGGSQYETAPWLPPDPSPLGLGAEPHVERG